MSSVVRYRHYSIMIFGANRLPLVEFFINQANESLPHADLVGEHITGLGHPQSIRSTSKNQIGML